MNIRSGEMSERGTFWVSVLFHLLILVIYLLMLRHHADDAPLPDKKPALDVPAYVYSDATPSPASEAQPKQQQAVKTPPVTESKQDQQTSKSHAQPVVNQKDSDFDLNEFRVKQEIAKQAEAKAAIEEPSLSSFNPAQMYKHTEPVHMIGEKLADDPLQKLLGIAITRHLYYPEAAQQLRMHGMVAVGFMLFPDGTATNVRVMETSKERVLDSAAMAAIREMGPIANVDIYVKKPRFLIVNIIFN